MPRNTTSRGGLPFYSGGDAPAGMDQQKDLAETLASFATLFDQGAFANRPAATVSRKGWLYYAADADVLLWCTGTAWKVVYAKPVLQSGGVEVATTTDADTPYPQAAAVAPVAGTYDVTSDTNISVDKDTTNFLAHGFTVLLGVGANTLIASLIVPTSAPVGVTYGFGSRSLRVPLAKGATVQPALNMFGNGTARIINASTKLTLVEVA